jgi:hypothetical protein
MFKFIALLSLFSIGSARVIGSDPQTWSPNVTPILAPLDKCEACKILAGNVANFIQVNEQNIVNCDVEDEIKLIGDILQDPQMFCETIQICKKRFWWF